MYARKYVDVVASFGADGRLTPVCLIWDDGRRFPIEKIGDVRPAASLKAGGQGDRYAVRIAGQDRYLFFEHSPAREDAGPGRWFVEAPVR